MRHKKRWGIKPHLHYILLILKVKLPFVRLFIVNELNPFSLVTLIPLFIPSGLEIISTPGYVEPLALYAMLTIIFAP